MEASATAWPFAPGGFHCQHAVEPPGKVSNSRGSALPAAVDIGWGGLRNAAGLVDDCFPPFSVGAEPLHCASCETPLSQVSSRSAGGALDLPNCLHS